MMNRCACFLLLLSLPVGRLLAQAPSRNGIHSSCQFHRAGDHFVGSCGSLFHQDLEMTLRSAPSISTGAWRSDIKPLSVWSGDMTDRGFPNARLELEIYNGNWGVLRTEYGWFPVSGFVANSTLSFELDSTQQVKPSALDYKILQKAAEILSTEDAWNRADNRKCPADATKLSIYCALEKAEIEVTGGFHHRRPAAEIVRQIVEQRAANRGYPHHLMGYNNDPTTHLQDVQTLFKEAESEIKNLQ